ILLDWAGCIEPEMRGAGRAHAGRDYLLQMIAVLAEEPNRLRIAAVEGSRHRPPGLDAGGGQLRVEVQGNEGEVGVTPREYVANGLVQGVRPAQRTLEEHTPGALKNALVEHDGLVALGPGHRQPVGPDRELGGEAGAGRLRGTDRSGQLYRRGE